MKKLFLIMLIAIAVAISAFAVPSTVPSTITYQGRLLSSGSVVNGNVTMRFALYDAASGGTKVWPQSVSYEEQIINVVNGLYTAYLGTTYPFSSALFNTNLYLEVTVDGTTLTPRTQLMTTPYSYYSGIAKTVDDGAISTSKLADDAITAQKISDDAVTAAKINADIAGLGLVQNVSGALDVNVDGSTLEIATDIIAVKDGGITDAKIVAMSATKLTGTVAIANGGTGATTAEGARTNLQLGALAMEDGIYNDLWTGDPLSIANGGTGATTVAGAKTALGLATVATTGSFFDLLNLPNEYPPLAHNQAWSTITATPTTVAGYNISDAMTTAHAANVITSTNIANWNTAYGWGDHSTEGYLTSEVDGVIGNEVKDATNGTLTRSGTGTALDPYTLGLNLENANTWTGAQTFDNVTVTGTLTGNASSASKVNNALTQGAGIANFSFDGSATATIAIANEGVTNAMLAGLIDQSKITDLTTDLTARELVSNKSGDFVIDGASETKYPNMKATKDYVDSSIGDFGDTIYELLDGKSDIDHTHLLVDVTDVTASANELNILDGATLSTTELNLLDGNVSNNDKVLITNAGVTTWSTIGTANITDGTIAGGDLASDIEINTTGNITGAFGSFTNLAAYNGIAIGSSLPTTYYLPSSRGTNGQILVTDASGNVTWTSPLSKSEDNTWSGTQTFNNVTVNGTLTGDLIGNATTASNLTAGGANNVYLGGATANSWGLISNNNIASDAAIAGTKITPDFGAQAVSTTGTLTAGATTLNSTLQFGTGTAVSSIVTDLTTAADTEIPTALAVKNAITGATLSEGNGIDLALGVISVDLDGTSLSNGVDGLSLNVANPNTWTGKQSFSTTSGPAFDVLYSGNTIIHAGAGHNSEGYLKTRNSAGNSTLVTLGSTLAGERGAVSVGHGNTNSAADWKASMVYLDGTEFGLTGTPLADKWMVGTGELTAQKGAAMLYNTASGASLNIFNGNFTAPTFSVEADGDLKANELMLNSGKFRVAEDGNDIPWVNILKGNNKVMEIGLGTSNGSLTNDAGYGININDDNGNFRTGMGYNQGAWVAGVVGAAGYQAGAITSGGSDAMLAVFGGSETPVFTANQAGAVTATSVTATTFTGALVGNASTATKLAATKDFSLTGDVTATAIAFDGSGNVALSTTLGDNTVESANIVNGSITNDDINANAAIAVSKIAPGTNGQLLSVVAGVTSWVDAPADEVNMTTENAVPKWDGSKLVDGPLVYNTVDDKLTLTNNHFIVTGTVDAGANQPRIEAPYLSTPNYMNATAGIGGIRMGEGANNSGWLNIQEGNKEVVKIGETADAGKYGIQINDNTEAFRAGIGWNAAADIWGVGVGNGTTNGVYMSYDDANAADATRIMVSNGNPLLPTFHVDREGDVIATTVSATTFTGALVGNATTATTATNLSAGGANNVYIGGAVTNSWGLISNNNIASDAAIVDTKLAKITTSGKVANSALSESVSLLGQTIDLESEVVGVLPLTKGGTGANNAADARTALGLVTVASTGSYTDLSNVPTEFTPAAHNQAWSTITATPTTLTGYGITDAASSTHGHDAATDATAGFMSAVDKAKLDGIEEGANNYEHPSGDGNLHVPATLTTNNGKVLVAGATAGSAAWSTLGTDGLTADAVTAAKINEDVAGNGLGQNNDGSLELNVNNTLVVFEDVLGINLEKTNTWSGAQTFGDVTVNGTFTANNVLATDLALPITKSVNNATTLFSITNTSNTTGSAASFVNSDESSSPAVVISHFDNTFTALSVTKGDVAIADGDISMSAGDLTMTNGSLNITSTSEITPGFSLNYNSVGSYGFVVTNPETPLETDQALAVVINNSDELNEDAPIPGARGLVVANQNSDNKSDALYVVHAGTGNAITVEANTGYGLSILSGGLSVVGNVVLPPGSIETADIADLNVTDAKINDMNANKLTGTIANARLSADVSLLGTAIDMSSEVVGVLPIENGGTGSNNINDFISSLNLATVATSGSYNDLTDKPTAFSGSYDDLTDVPSSFTPATHSHTASDITGLTASVNELNILDGVTATASQINVLQDITASPAEINVLDGITATTNQLNLLGDVVAGLTGAELSLLDGNIDNNGKVIITNAGVTSWGTIGAGAIADGSITKSKLASNVAGNGLTQELTGEISVVLGSSLSLTTNAIGINFAEDFTWSGENTFNGDVTVLGTLTAANISATDLDLPFSKSENLESTTMFSITNLSNVSGSAASFTNTASADPTVVISHPDNTSTALSVTMGDVDVVDGDLSITVGDLTMANGSLNITNSSIDKPGIQLLHDNVGAYGFVVTNPSDLDVLETDQALAVVINNSDEANEDDPGARGLVVYNTNTNNKSDAIFAINDGTGSAITAVSAGGLGLNILGGGASITGTTIINGYTLPSDAPTTEGHVLKAGVDPTILEWGAVTATATGISHNNDITIEATVADDNINLTTSGTGKVVASNGINVTTGGLTVSAGGASIAGASSITASSASTALTVTQIGEGYGLEVFGGGAFITGPTSVFHNHNTVSALTVSNTSGGAGLSVANGGINVSGTSILSATLLSYAHATLPALSVENTGTGAAISIPDGGGAVKFSSGTAASVDNLQIPNDVTVFVISAGGVVDDDILMPTHKPSGKLIVVVNDSGHSININSSIVASSTRLIFVSDGTNWIRIL